MMFQWFRKPFRSRPETLPARPRRLETVPHAGPFGAPPPFDGRVNRIYQQSPWVYVAVNRIAEAAALVPLHIVRPSAGGEARLPDHPLLRLLARPNPSLSRFELLEQTVGMLELAGNAYWYLTGDAAGRPAHIWPLAPERMHIVADQEGHVSGYVYEVDGQRTPLGAEEIVHFRRWHPADALYGLSALEAARLAVQSDRAMAEWNAAAFGQDRGVPAGIVSVKDFISDADFERLKRDWSSSYGGGQRRTAFLRGGAVEWQHMGLSHQDLDFLKGRAAHRDEILNIFGVPVGMLSENATEANAKVAERLFIERTLWPKLERIAQKITQEMLPFWGGGASVRFEDIRPTDTQARLAEIQAAAPVLSINEIRARFYAMPPVPWGDGPASGALDSVPSATR
jgi:HK97 family phage portal protein